MSCLQLHKMRKLALLLVLVALIARSYGVPYGKSPRPFQTQEEQQYYDQQVNQEQSNVFYDNVEQKGYEYPEQQFVESEQGQITLGSNNHIASGDVPGYESAGGYGVSQESGYDQNAQNLAVPEQIAEQVPHAGNDLTLSCNGQNRICVPKQDCVNGHVSLDEQDIDQLTGKSRQCDVNYEVCCSVKLRYGPPPPATEENAGYPEQDIEPPYAPSGSGVFVDQSALDQNAGQADEEGSIDLPGQVAEETPNEEPEASVDSGASVQLPSEVPVNSGDASDAVPSVAQVPQVPVETSGSNLAPTHLQLGCAAALVCVEERFCTLEGSISPEPVVFTEKQLFRRVPLSDCKNPDNGVIGKCCRDPNYVDPWPAGNLPANYSGGFDEQGFPTFLNIAKTRPPKKPVASGKIDQPVKTSHPTKTGRPTKTIPRPSVNVVPQVPVVSPIPVLPQVIPVAPNQIPNVHVPLSSLPVEENVQPEVPLVPDNSEVFSSSIPIPSQVPIQPAQPILPVQPVQPVQPVLPVLPVQSIQPAQPIQPTVNTLSVPRPFSRPNYDSASSLETSVQVVPKYSQQGCGVKNSVPRPVGLRDAETAFSEIPWQAMILSTEYRKILCSGVIIAPDAVLTAGHCVDGLHPSQISIKAGEWKLGYELKHEEPLPFEIVNVAQIKINPSYSSGLPSNDTAILLLERSVSLDAHVNTLCLPENPEATSKAHCIVTGWGKSEIQIHAAGAIMRGIDVDVLPYNACEERLSGAESHLDIDTNVICAKTHKQNNNMCQVEPGSPLACDRGNGVYELVGIYSQDTGCLPTNQVAVFAPLETSWMQTSLSTLSPPKVETKVEVPVLPIEPDHEPSAQHEIHDFRKSNYPSENNQYLPPV